MVLKTIRILHTIINSMVMTPSSRMIIKTMIKNSFIKIILFFLTNYVVVIDGTCFQDNTYITYAGNERFPSTTEKSAEFCQGIKVYFEPDRFNIVK